MVEVEAGFKILEDKLSAEKILLAHGFVNTYKTHTRDIYFGKDTNFENKDEDFENCVGLNLQGIQTPILFIIFDKTESVKLPHTK